MMRLRTLLAGLTILTVAGVSFPGCSAEPTGTNIEVKKPLTAEELKKEQDKVKEGMKTGGGGYMGAPGVPKSKAQ